ncbi:unnamed protein product [Ectocarpus sp. CCAP 1310/34]|nr:unnamed protein product [Ectocarpus sp. CCAP 1310/34]
MTGTPTPTTSADAALRNLSNLLNLLREKEYSPEWRRNVRGPFIANKPEGRERLRRLLSEVMIRHTKADLLSIPPPVRESALLNMSQQETLAYDTIVSFVRSNLLLTSMEGKTSGWQDSLLNPANTKYAMEALTNIRLSCCGGGTLIPMVKGIHQVETLDMLRDLHDASAVDLRRIDNFITRATMGEVSSCQICVDCVDCVNNTCRVCGSRYDVDDFQRLQPGFELKWMYNIREQKRLHQQRRAAARLARRGAAGNNQANSTPASPSPPDVATVHQALSPHPEGGGASRGTGGGGSSGPSPPGAGSPASPGGGGGLEVEADGEELEMHSKAFYAIEQLKGIRDKAKSSNRRRGDYRPLKAIVFSQFLPVLNIVGDKFLRELGGFPEEGWQRRGEKCVAEFWGKNRAKELERFRTDPECFVLLLGKRGAHGLDLSFVTHMFLMDQIWDRSLETQVVARANRMGAKGSVSVVQLIMKDTMEQELRSYVNSDKTRNAAPTATPGSRWGSLSPSHGSPDGHTAHPSSPLRGARAAGGVDDRFPANGGVGGSTPTPPRKKPREKSPWEGRGRKRPRSGGSGKRVTGGGGLSASSRQEHAKVHFLLTSLRPSKAAAAQGGDGGEKDKEKPRGGEEEEEEEDGEGDAGALSSARQGNVKGKGKGKGKGKKAVRRGVTFAEDVVVVQDKAVAAVEDPRWRGEAAAGGGGASAASPDRVIGWSP